MRIPDPEIYDDGMVVWSKNYANEGVGVLVGTNLFDDPGEIRPDRVPIRVRVTTEDGTGSAYLTTEEAYELVQVLGMAITRAKEVERQFPSSPSGE